MLVGEGDEAGEERVGDVSNVVFSNGWVARDNGDVFIYYGSSDTRTHVATSTVDRLLDYVTKVTKTPADCRREDVDVRMLGRGAQFAGVGDVAAVLLPRPRGREAGVAKGLGVARRDARLGVRVAALSLADHAQ